MVIIDDMDLVSYLQMGERIFSKKKKFFLQYIHLEKYKCLNTMTYMTKINGIEKSLLITTPIV